MSEVIGERKGEGGVTGYVEKLCGRGVADLAEVPEGGEAVESEG